MSKTKQVKIAKKRYNKTLKRKNKNKNVKPLPENSLGVMLKKAKYAAVNGIQMEFVDPKKEKEFMDDAKKYLAEIYKYFNYLVFVKSLVDSEVINENIVNIDFIKTGKTIIDLNRRLKLLPLLDEERVFATELFEVSAAIQELALTITTTVSNTEKYGNIIYPVILDCGNALPPKENGEERTKEEVINEVIKIYGQDFFYNNFSKAKEQTVEGNKE